MSRLNLNYHPIYNPVWKPKEQGDTIEGEILSYGERPIKDSLVPFVELITESGEIVEILMGTAALRRLFESGKLQEGLLLGIRYDGEDASIKKANNCMKRFSYALATADGQAVTLEDGETATIDEPQPEADADVTADELDAFIPVKDNSNSDTSVRATRKSKR